MSKEKILAMQKQVTGKLMAAISMLLVSAILMCLTSYAWFILSTAPEVSNLKTTAGANGALEIALQSTNTAGNGRAEITSAVGSSHAKNAATVSNTYWGNVVDLTEGYGLEHVTLYPSRLKLNATELNGQTSYAVDTGSILQVPQFGQDGRVTGLLDATKTHYEGGKFTTGSNWGVNVLGAVSEKVGEEDTIVLTYARDIVLEQAREKVAAYRAELRSDMKNLIERNSMGIMTMLMATLFNDEMDRETQYITVKDYVASMDATITQATEAVRWALLANAAADEAHFNSKNKEDMKALGDIYSTYMQLALTGEKSIAHIADQYGYAEVAQAARALATASGRIEAAKKEINDTTMDTGSAAMALVRVDEAAAHGTNEDGTPGPADKVKAAHNALAEDFTRLGKTDTIYMFIAHEDMNLFSALASVVGDYAGDMTVWITEDGMVGEEPADLSGCAKWVYTIKASCGKGSVTDEGVWRVWQDVDDLKSVPKQEDGTFAADANVGALGTVLNQIEGIKAPGTIQVEITRSDVTAYGYSIDLAFQSSVSTNLLLQQLGINRVNNDASGGDTEAPDTQGGGSTIEFAIAGDVTEEQVQNLLQGLHIVFMNTGTGMIYKVAAIDPASITINWTGIPVTASGVLALYEPVFGEGGTLSLGGKTTDTVITALTKDTPSYISAVVYLSGDAVDSTVFSATQGLSLTGALNLQFASSETLTPMNYTSYKRKE